ncbi:sec-independent protein translocase protein TatA [Haematococcus lacustris]
MQCMQKINAASGIRPAAKSIPTTQAFSCGHVRSAVCSAPHLWGARSPRHPQQPATRAPVRCQGLFGLGLPEIAVIAGIAALVFGPSKLPELGKGLGQTVKSFQTAAKEFETELKAASKGDEPTATPGSAEEAKKDLKQ